MVVFLWIDPGTAALAALGEGQILSNPSVRQCPARASLPHAEHRTISVAKANRASGVAGRPGQLGTDGQASGMARSRQRARSWLKFKIEKSTTLRALHQEPAAWL
jgi:hypothetical protein